MLSIDRLKKIDSTFFSLLAVNVLTIFIAVWNQWSIQSVLWVYWSQSVIIGLFYALRMKRLIAASPLSETLKVMNSANTVTMNLKAPKIFSPTFFLFHYGGFHFVYAIFIAQMSMFQDPFVMVLPTEVKVPTFTLAVIGSIVLFFLNHLYSYMHTIKYDISTMRNPVLLMFLPYIRIFPLHIFIVIGAFTGSVVFFLILKTGADLLMHQLTHAKLANIN